MSCIHTSKCSFSEGFFPVVIWGYFLFQNSPQWAPKYHFAEHKITELANSSKKGRVESVWWSHTPESNLSVSFSPVIIWGYFLFHQWPRWALKSHFAVSTKIVLAKCFLRTQQYLCGRNSQITKEFLRKLLSRFELMIFLYQRRLQCDPKKSFSGSSNTVLMNCSRKHKCNSVRWIHTSPRSF